MLNIIVCISGNGSNLQSIIDAVANKQIHANIVCVLSNKAQAYGLTRAKNAGIATEVIVKKDFSTREEYDQALCTTLENYQPDLIVLAGFMHILDPHTVQRFEHKIINIHPSLLPKYPGVNTYERALANKEKEHGATVHYVTADLDAGPIISQKKFSITPEDTPESLKQKTQVLEHQLYPEVIATLCEK